MGIIVANLELSKNNKDQITTSQDFSSFKNNYLLVYSLMMAWDWLQGPYVYYLYTTYGYGKGDIGQLFIAGFGSSMPFGTIVGSLADKQGRKRACITYWITYILSCMTKHSPQYKVLLLGRILGGVATSLLFSAFESWLVAEHNKVLRTVQVDGIRGLYKAERKSYAPPAGSGFISGFTSMSRRPSKEMSFSVQSIPFGTSSYLSAQARVVEEYTMSQIILQAVTNGGANGMLVVVTGASHVAYGSRGTGVPARIARKMQKKKNLTVIFLDPERQYIRHEGEVHVADFLWYSAARPCMRNCFDRAKIARVMNAAGRRRDALPQDIQTGLDLGLVSPEVLQNLFDLEQYPLLAELAHNFQGFRER